MNSKLGPYGDLKLVWPYEVVVVPAEIVEFDKRLIVRSMGWRLKRAGEG